MEMDAQYFIDKFEAIPEEKWAIGAYQLSDNTRCAFGHCSGHILNDYPHTNVYSLLSIYGILSFEGVSLYLLFDKIGSSVALVNDGLSSVYKQQSPKQRILAALRDIKAKEDQESAVQEVKEILEVPLCSECGRPVTKCVCEPNDLEEDEDQDWGAGEAYSTTKPVLELV